MFYEPKDGHGLPKNPFNSLVIPRPIGWITSVDGKGNVNLAPYSFFNGVAYTPPTVMFSAGYNRSEGSDGMKDSLRNVLETGEFVHNFATWDLREQMNKTCSDVPSDVPSELPSFASLPERQRGVICFTQAKLGFNHGWLVQAEAPPGALFSKFKEVIRQGGEGLAEGVGGAAFSVLMAGSLFSSTTAVIACRAASTTATQQRCFFSTTARSARARMCAYMARRVAFLYFLVSYGS